MRESDTQETATAAGLIAQIVGGLRTSPLTEGGSEAAEGDDLAAFQLPDVSQPVWSERNLRDLLDVGLDGLLAIDAERTILWINSRLERMLGYSRSELLGRPVEFLAPRRLRARHTQFWTEQLSHADARSGESSLDLLLRRSGGGELPVEICLSPIRTEEGILFAAAVRDVSRHRKLEARYRMLVEEIPAVTFLASLDEDSNELYVSPQIESMLGFTQQEWLQDPLLWFRQLHPEDSRRWHAEFAQTVATGKPFRSVYRFIARDGRTVWVNGEARVLRDGAGQPLFLQGIAFDITERKEAEEVLQRSRQELEETVRQRTAELQAANELLAEDIRRRELLERELFGAHERLSLSNITLEQRVSERTRELEHTADQLRLLAAQLTDAEQRERRRLAGVMHDHLQQLLVAAKIRVDSAAAQAKPAAIASALKESSRIIADAIQETRTLTTELVPPVLYEHGLGSALRWLAERMHEQHGLTVDLDLDGDAELAREQPRALLFEAVRELLFNIVKYAERQAGVSLKLTDDRKVLLTVTDTGPGFDPAMIDQKRSDGGGFGLFSIRERLRALGGDFRLDSRPGSCTRVELIMPVGEGPALIEAAAPTEPATTAQEGSAEPPIAVAPGTIRVMLVDDHRMVRQGIANLLQREQKIVVVGQAADGLEAIAKARQLRPDVVVIDVNMPGIGGEEATRLIKSELPQTRIVGLSMRNEPETIQMMLRAGASAHLNKAGDPEELIRAILDPAQGA